MHVKQLSFISSMLNYCIVATTFRKLVFPTIVFIRKVKVFRVATTKIKNSSVYAMFHMYTATLFSVINFIDHSFVRTFLSFRAVVYDFIKWRTYLCYVRIVTRQT